MARVVVPVTEIVRAGTTPPSQVNGDAPNDHYYTGNTGQEYIEVVSSDGGAQTVTVKANPAISTVDGLTVSDLVISIPAGATRLIGPFKNATFSQNATNDIYFDPSVSTNLKFRVYKLPRNA